jgi:basic amino acid/polyamine antiporter, APA family
MEKKKPKLLGLWDTTMIVISLVIGMGIFKTPASVAKSSLNETIFFSVWIVGGIIAFCGALTYAEIGSRLPVTGGYFKIFTYAYHPSIAFGVNGIILLSNAVSLSIVALIGGEYLQKLLHENNYLPKDVFIKQWIAIAAILIFYLINLLGLKTSALTQTILMIIKFGLIALVITPLFFSTSTPIVETNTLQPANTIDTIAIIKSFGIALIAVTFTYGGYQHTINFGNEVNKASSTIPRSIIIGTLVVIAIYLLTNYAYYSVIGYQNLKHAEGIAGIMVGKIFGKEGQFIVTLLLFFSVLGYVNGQMMNNPRVMEAMATDNMLPASFAKRMGNRQVPFIALTAFAITCIAILSKAEKIDSLLSFTTFLDCIGMILSAGSIFLLRKKKVGNHSDGFRMKWYPLFPVLFIVAFVFIATIIAITETNNALLGYFALSVFMSLYFIKEFLNRKK